MLETLLANNEELRQQNIALEMENRRLQHTLDLDSRRHREQHAESTFSDMYDWIVDIQLLSDVSKQGWRVEFSGDFLTGLDQRAREQLLADTAGADPTTHSAVGDAVQCNPHGDGRYTLQSDDGDLGHHYHRNRATGTVPR